MTTIDPQTRFRLRRWFGEFADPATERAFRQSTLRDGRAINRIAFSVIAASAVGHIATDYILYGFANIFFYLLAMRLCIASVLLLAFPITAAPRSIPRMDAGIFALQMVLIATFF